MQTADLIDVIALSKLQCRHPIQAQLKYATNDNLVGRCIDGYDPQAVDFALLSKIPAENLCKAQGYLNQKNYGLLIYDAYRPQRAVKDFLVWSKAPINPRELPYKKKILSTYRKKSII